MIISKNSVDTYADDLETKDVRLARQAAEILEVTIELMDLDVGEAADVVNVPVLAAQVILAHCVLNQVHFLGHLDGVGLRDEQQVAELAQDVSVVDQTD